MLSKFTFDNLFQGFGTLFLKQFNRA